MKADRSGNDLSDTVMGKITSVYGVKGWVKVFSYTQPKENLRSYRSWMIERGKERREVSVLECKAHGNGLVARIEGINDREAARGLSDFLIKVSKDQLPDLESGEYYWHQLEGLFVYSSADKDADGVLLGRVDHMMETGSNDVMVVKACKDSLDKKERLIPYLEDQVVKTVDLSEGTITVDWDPEF